MICVAGWAALACAVAGALVLISTGGIAGLAAVGRLAFMSIGGAGGGGRLMGSGCVTGSP